MSCIGVLTLFSVVVCSQCYFSVFSFSKTLYIPGQYYSLINFTQSIEPLSNYFNISVDFSLTQSMFADQANSVYDTFLFDRSQYPSVEPCYQSAVNYLSQLYNQFEPCQGGCVFNSITSFNQNASYMDFTNSQFSNISFIVDNTFYPCSGGVYQSEIYLKQTLDLKIETNQDYLLIFKIVLIVLMQILIFLIAYFMILMRKLHHKKEVLQKLKQEREDSEVINSAVRQNQQ